MPKYDFLIVGAGLFGSTFAYEANQAGKKVLVIDQRDHIGGNCYTEKKSGIEVHKYGAHIFHTDNELVWMFINLFTKFKPFINSPIAIVDGQTYNLPFNMNLFSRLFGVSEVDDVISIINKERATYGKLEPTNLEEKAISMVGTTIYEKFIKNYTEKQWGKSPKDLPPDIISRLPLRFTYDNNYFDDKYQGIPVNGYTEIFKNMLKGIEVKLSITYKQAIEEVWADEIIYTGMIDEFFDYKYGELEYRSLKFVEIEKDIPNYQGNAIFNFPTHEKDYIRRIEHKHFTGVDTPTTIISYEFSYPYSKGMIPFYPVKTKRNQNLYARYQKEAEDYPNVHFSGRLGGFKYYDMDDTINNALDLADKLL